MPSHYAAVWVDQPIDAPQQQVAGAAMFSSAAHGFATTRDPRFVILRHPAEEHDLERTGYQWKDLIWQGRFVSVRNVICRECGTLFPRRRLAPPGGTGCMTSLMLGIVASLFAAIWFRRIIIAVAIWYAATFGTLLLTGSLASLYIRLRFRARAASLAAERACPNCGADHARTIERAKAIKCSACGNTTMNFSHVGIS
jgi:hypothetical protein